MRTKTIFICVILILSAFTFAKGQTGVSSEKGLAQEIKALEAQNAGLKDKSAALQKRIELLKEKARLEAEIVQNQAELAGMEGTGTATPAVSKTSAAPSKDVTTEASSTASTASAAPAAPAPQAPPVPQAADLINTNCFTRQTGIKGKICDLAKDIVQRKIATPGAGISQSLNQTQLIGIILRRLATDTDKVDKKLATFLLQAEGKRNDKQAGGDAKSSGSTSLVVKGGVPRFLSWATENGAVESTKDGTTLTFRANLFGFAEAVTKKGIFKYLNDLQPNQSGNQLLSNIFPAKEDTFARLLKRTSVGLSYDLNRDLVDGNQVFTGKRQQLSAVSVRYNFLNGRDPMDKRYAKKWSEFADDVGTAFNTASNNVWQQLEDPLNPGHFKEPILEAWVAAGNVEVAKAQVAPANRIEAVEEMYGLLAPWTSTLDVATIAKNQGLMTAFTNKGNAVLDYATKRDAILDDISKGEVFTFEYTNFRETNAPDLSNFRAILSKGLYGGDLTFNASLTMFNKKPVATALANVKRIRDFDFALQFDIPLPIFNNKENLDENIASAGELSVPKIGTPILSFAGKYQRLQSDAVQPDGIVKPNTRGDLAFGQIKVMIPVNIAGFDVKLPFSLSFANRSDLIKEKDVRGNFGFTFDIDPFFSKLKESLSKGLFK